MIVRVRDVPVLASVLAFGGLAACVLALMVAPGFFQPLASGLWAGAFLRAILVIEKVDVREEGGRR